MKVESSRGFGLARGVVAGFLLAAALGTGAGFFQSRTALASIDDGGRVGGQARELAPLSEPDKAEQIRQPSGLDAAEVGTRSQRTPTTVRPKIARITTTAAASSSGAAATPDGWKRAKVSWYGPGFIGNTMAGGGSLDWGSMVVAHRSMAFGTRIEFAYQGKTCVAVVMDRGPYAGGRTFDLGPGTAAALGFSGVGTVDYRIIN